MREVRLLASLVMLIAATASAAAQSRADGLLRIVSPFPAGGGADTVCRLVADHLRAALGQTVIVENRTGAGGAIGAEAVARAAPDGRTVLCAPDPVFTSHLLSRKSGFDPRVLEPVSVVVSLRMGLVARPDLPVRDLAGLIAHARAHPGKLTYASQGPGQYGHLVMEAIKFRAGVDLLHVPFGGAAPALNGIYGGQVDLFAGTLVSLVGHIESGRVTLLAPTGARRLAAYPDVAALPEVLPGLAAESWIALAVPPRTPPSAIQHLAEAARTAVRSADMQARLEELQCEPLGTTPAEMRQMLDQATAQWSRVIEAARISLD